ncbi:hypothetical protein D3C74_378810 [compost metagenome]
MRALGHATSSQRRASWAWGRRQQASSGQVEARRAVVSRPRNHLAEANGTPTVIENSPVVVVPVCVLHQNVPAGVSVYW